MITPVCNWPPILAQTLAASTCFRLLTGADTGPSFGWRSVYLNSRRRPPSSAQHLTDANSDTGPITIADSWLSGLGQYFAVFSPPAICTWDLSSSFKCTNSKKLFTENKTSCKKILSWLRSGPEMASNAEAILDLTWYKNYINALKRIFYHWLDLGLPINAEPGPGQEIYARVGKLLLTLVAELS